MINKIAGRLWNSGAEKEEFEARGFLKEYNEFKEKYGDGSIPLRDFYEHWVKSYDERSMLHNGLAGQGLALKNLVKVINS